MGCPPENASGQKGSSPSQMAEGKMRNSRYGEEQVTETLSERCLQLNRLATIPAV